MSTEFKPAAPRLFGRKMGLNNDGSWSRKFGSAIEVKLVPDVDDNGKREWMVLLIVFAEGEEAAFLGCRSTLGAGAALLERRLVQMARGLKGVPL